MNSPGGAATAGKQRALCFLMDEDFVVRQDLARTLRANGVDVSEFSNSERFLDQVEVQRPDIVFVDLRAGTPHECVRALLALKESGFSGAVQLFGSDVKMLQSFNTVGTDCALAMLPPLQKPLTAAMVHKVILAQKLHAPATTASVALSEALAANWVGFLYQPKFDLKSGTMVGAELVARVVHPEHGLLMPDQFLKGADEDALIALSRLALTAALKASVHFHGIGIALQLAVNISADTLLRVPVADIAMLHRPDSINWPGLLLEIPERQVVSKIEFLKARAAKLQQAGVSIAIDNFGRGACRMDIFKLLQFAEIKVDRSLVQGCSVDTGNANICKTLIQMGHNFGCRTAAVGISDAEDMRTIRALGCDIGQGFQLSKPMTLKAINELIASFKNRDP